MLLEHTYLQTPNDPVREDGDILKTALIALGGNAIRRAGEKGEFSVQIANTAKAASVIADLVSRGYHLIITHGNGPQVGDILLQNELSSKSVPPAPLDACGAESQGLIGYMLTQSLNNEFIRRGMDQRAICILTQTIVREDDPAFHNPTKPVGSYYNDQDGRKLQQERGWTMVKDVARGGFRRVVPSPEPVETVEGRMLKSFFDDSKNGSNVLVVSGGGGIPVVETEDGFRGVEAVIDKDLAAQVVASYLGVDQMLIITDVDAVFLNFGTEKQRELRKCNVLEAQNFMLNGEFGKGSMLPKVVAATRFVGSGGKSAIITSDLKILDALNGKAGTTITKE